MAKNVGLSKDMIIERGLELTASVGLTQVTSQRIADSLGVSAVAISYYCPRAGLHAEIAERAVSEVTYPPSTEGTWDSRLRYQALCWQEVMGRYPGVQGFVASYPRLLPGVRHLIDDAVEDLIASGLDESAAKLAYGHYHAFFIGWNVVRSVVDEHAGASTGRYGWTRSEQLFEFAVESHLEMMRLIGQGKWDTTHGEGQPASRAFSATRRRQASGSVAVQNGVQVAKRAGSVGV